MDISEFKAGVWRKTFSYIPRISVAVAAGLAGEIPVFLPPISEQQQITYTLVFIDKKIEAEENRKSVLQALFKTMLHLLMTGRIRVKELITA